MKQFEAAIDLIADDDTPQAKRLRADMAWDSGNWTGAGAKAEDVVGDRWNTSGPLNDEERAQIMRAAVAYSLGNEQTALDRLREHYAAKMQRDRVKQIATVDTLQAFMADFKKQGAAAATKTAQK